MKRRRHSLSGRLLLLFLVTALLLALVIRAGFRYGIEGSYKELAGHHLDEYLQHLLAELGDPPTPKSAARLAERLPLQVHLLGVEDWSSEGTPPAFEPRRSIARMLPDGTPLELGHGSGGFLVRAQRGGVTVLLVPHRIGPAVTEPLAILLTIAGVLAVLAFGYHATRRLFGPIETIQAGVARIGGGDLEHRLRIPRRDELGELAHSINAMADDIGDMLEAKRQLLLAISHELRSPLTRARINAELLEDNANRAALLASLSELEALLSELLESERLRGQHAALKREAVDPSELLTDLVDDSFRNAGICLDLDPPGTWLPLDPTRIRLMARNLLKNALHHTPADGPAPSLSSHVDEERWLLKVSDSGPGIEAKHLEHLAEPFYRVDAPRPRASGGVGLGLYLSRMIAEAHGGDLRIDSAPGRGTRVRILIPLSVDT